MPVQTLKAIAKAIVLLLMTSCSTQQTYRVVQEAYSGCLNLNRLEQLQAIGYHLCLVSETKIYFDFWVSGNDRIT